MICTKKSPKLWANVSERASKNYGYAEQLGNVKSIYDAELIKEMETFFKYLPVIQRNVLI